MENTKYTKGSLTKEQLFERLENTYNEVYVVDKDMTIIYVNSACLRNYGLRPEDMIGKNHNIFTGGVWYPSVLPKVFKEKKRMSVEQVTYLGKKIFSTATPVFDQVNNIDLVVCVTEERFESLDIQYIHNKTIVNYVSEVVDTDEYTEDYKDIITHNNALKTLIRTASRCAKKDLSILIQGESGTGKSMLARYIHNSSLRSNGAFMTVNCAAIPEDLLESELFGYEPYAFTGASPKGKIGLIESANGGTLFLDEVGELTLPLQAKLLHVIDNKNFIPIGGKKLKHIDTRIITATNQNLQKMVEDKAFREDLYWRINVIDLVLPTLRERKDDILLLSDYFLNKANAKYGTSKFFSKEVLDIFNLYDWPGNIRQLKNVIERCVIMASSDSIELITLQENIIKDAYKNKNTNYDYETYMEQCAKKIIVNAYKKYGSSRKLATALKISQSTANRLIKKNIVE